MKGVGAAKMFLLWFILMRAGSLQAAIIIDSVSARPSNCANDGSFTIHARSNSPMLYAIVSGPDIRPAQSGSQFGGLPIGAYQIMVTNFSNDTMLANANVGGTYQFPDFAPTWQNPYCAGTSTGQIVCSPIAGLGRPPFTWRLTHVATNTVTTQTSDTFSTLSAGAYQIRMYDSCQAFATRYVTLTDPNTQFTMGLNANSMISCDSVVIEFVVTPSSGGTSASPYTVTVTTANGVFTNTFNATLNSYGYYIGSIGVPGVTCGDSANVVVVNACGQSAYAPNLIADWDYRLYFPQQVATCGIGYYVVQDFLASTYTSNTYFRNYPFTLQVWDSTSSILFDSATINYNTNHSPPLLTPGHLYSISVSDLCGHFVLKSFIAPIPDTPRVTTYTLPYSCSDSTASVHIEGFNFTSRPILTFLSGPSLAQSSNPYFSHRDTIIYPIVYDDPLNGCAGYSPPSTCYQFGGLPVGTYQYTLHDTCGNIIAGSFTVNPQDLAAFAYQKIITKGCPGQNKINYDLYIPNQFFPGNTKIKLLNAPSFFDTSSAFILTIDSSVTPTTYRYSGNHTFSNLNAGTYVLESLPEDNYYAFPYVKSLISVGMSCAIFRDTIVIPPYQAPRIDYATQIKCNGAVNLGLLPDSSTGVPPYNYQILSGPQTAPVQADNFFTLTQPGTYVARISDTCGFARTFTFTVDTLSFKQIVQVGSGCVGNTATLTAQRSPYATYVWQRPNGSFYTGDSLRISPVTPADYGVYHISKIVSVNACRDTFYTTYTLTRSSISNQYDTICAGQSVNFGGNTYTLTGTYYDTISTPACDSIATLHLTVLNGGTTALFDTICAGSSVSVNGHTYSSTGVYTDTISSGSCYSISVLTLTVKSIITDSVTQTICPGQSVTVGGNTYSTAGVYNDTLTTATGCDSLHVLTLQIGNIKTDSVSLSICAGQSITVGSNTYNTTGIYRDTFSTAGCDSIHILNLTVAPQKTDSVYRSICLGESITVGTNTYTTTGIYRDTFTTSTGCDSIHIFNLRVAAYKYDSAAISLCFGQQLTLGTNTYNATGIYRDTFATATCDSIFVLNLTIQPQIKNTVSRSICSGQSITVGTNTYNTPGIYSDTLIASSGCDSIYILTLQVTDVLRDSATLAFCQGDSATLNGQTFTRSGIYTDTLNNGFCDSIFTLQVITYPVPSINITAGNVSVALGDTIQLNVTDPTFSVYQWSNSVFNNAQIANPVATISQSGWITLLVTDSNNCRAADSIYITVPECEENIFVPNAFTPNGDGINDVFRIYGNCIQLNSFLVFNRWGEKVWDSADMEQGWNGYYKGTAQPMAVYVYVVNYSPLSPHNAKARTLKGSVTLIR